jgi:hypothetical protein
VSSAFSVAISSSLGAGAAGLLSARLLAWPFSSAGPSLF